MRQYREQVGNAGPAGTSQVRVPNMDDGIGQALRYTGSQIERAGAQVLDTFEREALATTDQNVAQAQAWAREQLDSLRTAPAAEVETRRAEFQKNWTKQRDDILGKTKFPRAREMAQANLTRLQTGIEGEVRDIAYAASSSRTIDALTASLNSRAAQVVSDPSGYQRAVEEQVYASASSLLDQRAQAAMRDKIVGDLSLAAAQGSIQKDPAGTLKAIRDGSAPFLQGLTADQSSRLAMAAEKAVFEQAVGSRVSGVMQAFRKSVTAGNAAMAALADAPEEIRGEVQQRVRQEFTIYQDGQSRQYHDELVGIVRRVNQGMAGAKDVERLNTLYEAGALTEAQHLSHLSQYDDQRRRAAEAAAGAAQVQAIIDSGLPLDPGSSEHRKALDGAFSAATKLIPPGDARYLAVARGLAVHTRMLPPAAESWLSSAARSPDPQIANVAAEFYSSLTNVAPEAAAKVDGDTRAFLGVLSSMVSAGANPQRAFETARANVYETRRDLIEQRRQAFGAKDIRKGNDSALTNLIDRDFDTAFSRQPEATAALKADFMANTAAYFEKTGDIEVARQLAWSDVKAVYGVSEVNGRREILPFAPEAMYPGLTPQVIREDVAASVAENAAAVMTMDPATGKPVPATVDPKTVELVPFGDTSRTQGRRWYLGVRDEYGAPDVLRDAQNRPIVYELPIDPERYGKLRRDRLERDSPELRRQREVRQRAEAATADWLTRGPM